MNGVTGLLKAVVSLGWLALLSGGAWMGYQYLHREEAKDRLIARHEEALLEKEQELARKAGEIDSLQADVAVKQQEIQQQAEQIEHLDLSLKLLKVSKRVAQVAVLDKVADPETGGVITKVKFVEVDEDGESIADSRTFEMEGDVLYVDAWVVKFDDALVESGDPLRSGSLCVFRRMFGEHQEPANGAVLDTPMQRPQVYGGGEAPQGFEKQIWENFWELANDPSRARELGIRSIHGEAPSMKLEKGKVYKLTLRASGGLDFETLDLPSVLDN